MIKQFISIEDFWEDEKFYLHFPYYVEKRIKIDVTNENNDLGLMIDELINLKNKEVLAILSAYISDDMSLKLIRDIKNK